MKKKGIAIVAVVMGLFFCTACGSADLPITPGYSPDMGLHFNEVQGDAAEGSGDNYQYGSIVEQGETNVAQSPSSYFSLDRNTANYSLVRAQIRENLQIAPDSVRTEELYNYFSYDYPVPEKGEGMRVQATLSECPWNPSHRLMRVGLRSEERVLQAERNNYVFLIDVSGSMSANVAGTEYTCLGLVQYGMKTLLAGLSERDAVSIVTYASGTQVRLEPTLATENGKAEILKAIDSLTASGSTNGSGGIELAYEQAKKYYTQTGNNRVILASDGDFNVGVTNEAGLKQIAQKAENGVYLSVLGVGLGNMRDDFMQTLALNGNGNYAYLDSEREAEKVLSKELNGTLVTVAKDAKAGVTFNANNVERYRLVGYDSKILFEDDFNDEKKDAGEIGSNLAVTALYEIKLKEGVEENAVLASVAVRFQLAQTGEKREVKATLNNTLSASDDDKFLACVAEFGLVLRNSKYKGTASLGSAIARLENMKEYLAADEYKAEFLELVKAANAQEYYGN